MHRKKLKRFETGSIRFLTCSCIDRRPFLGTAEARDIVVDQLRAAVNNNTCLLHAFVVMPEHFHLLLTPCSTLDKFFGAFKRRSAERVNVLLSRKGSMWLPGGGYDRNIETRDEYREKLNYIHDNPVRRGLETSDHAWAWSSAAAYLDLPYEGPEITFVDTDFRW